MFLSSSIPSPVLDERVIWAISPADPNPFFPFSVKAPFSAKRSLLLYTTIVFLSFISSNISRSFSLRPSFKSTTYRMRSAFSASFLALSTPIFSITSPVSLMPAVSMMFSTTSPNTTVSFNTSLVVPAISVTMALSSSSKALRREDLPAFGSPNMQVFMPSLISLPSSVVSTSFFSFFSISSNSPSASSVNPSRLICSGSSSAASMYAVFDMIFSRISMILSFTLPLSCFTEFFNARLLFALMISITASAWERSILPFKNALLVNSPGSASLAPFLSTMPNIFFVTMIPPWQSISMTSSFV